MKRALIFCFIALFPLVAYADCRTHTYFIDGKMITCTTCCYGGSCNTTCF